MKKRTNAKKIFLISMIGIISSMPLQGAEVNRAWGQTTEVMPLYIDASEMKLPYQVMANGYVCPLQVQGELLAPFSQMRIGYTHEGIDIRAAEGTPVFAMADGRVTKAAPDSKGVDQGGGHMIFVDFGNGVEGRYMHLSGYGVQAGDVVKAGQVIGFTGNTGDSSTPHLHFEYRVGGVLMDPAFLFDTTPIGLYQEAFFVVQQ